MRAVTAIMATVVGLTFLFGFGNVLSLALRLGVPVWIAPLVAPAVDLSILGLLLAIRHLAVTGAAPQLLRPARRLLIFCSTVTLALNIADPIITGHWGRAAFDAVGPLLLIGWAEVGPGILHTIATTTESVRHQPARSEPIREPEPVRPPEAQQSTSSGRPNRLDELLQRARYEDRQHWEMHHRPISAETLRKRFRIGATLARTLVAMIRERPAQANTAT
ncbi:hypothetical protein MZC64_29080 [Crossiella sp. S99.2]|nr:hypothetical protein [Crossiella sp. S99.2]MCK2255810.1 hypothetical protein [Crossiella sp. S99.1]